MTDKKPENKVVKLHEDIVITNDDTVRFDFSDGYVTIHHDKPEPLNNAEVLYYLEMSCHILKNNI